MLSKNKYNNILLVDDSKVLQKLIRKFLKGFSCINIANDGVQGFEVYTETNPDLIILDINIPFLNGIELAKIIRRKNKKIPIIFITGDITIKINIVDLEPYKLIYKPFKAIELINNINSI